MTFAFKEMVVMIATIFRRYDLYHGQKDWYQSNF